MFPGYLKRAGMEVRNCSNNLLFFLLILLLLLLLLLLLFLPFSSFLLEAHTLVAVFT